MPPMVAVRVRASQNCTPHAIHVHFNIAFFSVSSIERGSFVLSLINNICCHETVAFPYARATHRGITFL